MLRKVYPGRQVEYKNSSQHKVYHKIKWVKKTMETLKRKKTVLKMTIKQKIKHRNVTSKLMSIKTMMRNMNKTRRTMKLKKRKKQNEEITKKGKLKRTKIS